MNKIILFLFSILFLQFFSCTDDNIAEIGEYTEVEFNEVIDMGTVVKGEIIKTTIELKNIGDYPLVIANVKPSCSCTVPDYDQEPVPPGSRASVSAEINTDRIGTGQLTKTVNITANTRPSTMEVTIKANVID